MSLQQQDILVPHTTEAYEQGGKYYLKTFLLDDSVARNGMGIQPEYIPKHINRFIDKPVILTPNFYHPHEFDHYQETGDPEKDLATYRHLQKPYVVGRIVKVETDSHIQQAGGAPNTRYSSILEISDEKAIAAFKQGKIPLYVSPSIYRVHNTDPVHSITDYIPLHIAIVDNPAYGFHKANIRAACSGDKIECGRMLAQASNGLGYCVEKKIQELNNIFSASNNPPDISSYLEKPLITSVKSLEVNSNETANSNSVPQQQEQPVQEQKEEQKTTPSIEQSIQEQKQKVEQSKTIIGTPAPSSPEVKQEEAPQAPVEAETPCAKAQADYEAKLAELEKEIQLNKEFRENFVKSQEENKIKSKRSRIENVIPANYANSEEERTKAIESLMNVQDEQLDVILNTFVIPATRNVRQGGLARKKVTDFVKEQDNNSKNIAQASAGPRVNSKDLQELERILSFGGTIVPKKNNSGGIA